MRRFTSLLGQDLVLAWRKGHILVIAFMMIVMAAIILLVPAEISSGPGEYILDSIPGRPLAEALLQQDARPEAVVAHQEELDQRLQENEDAIGIIVTGSIASPEIEIHLTRPVPDRTVNLLKASIDMVLAQLQEQEAPGSTNQSSVTVQRIRPQAEPVPLNLTGVPIFLAFEVGILGFLLVAVFVFQEKQEGTIRAYRVTPAGLWPYIASKTAVFTMLGIIYGFGVVLVGFGIDFNALALLGLIVYGSVFMTLFGLGFAAWFHNLSHWFFPGLAVLILNMLPFFSYIYPVFNPVWIQAIPSYGLVYALRETLFPTGDSRIVIETLGWGLIWIAGAAIFAGLSVQKKLLKGG